MENETVYLKNGQSANFVKKIDDENYIVQPHIVFYDHEGNEDYDYSEKTVVNEIFSKPPVERISKEYLEKIEAVTRKNDELHAITVELHQAENNLRMAKEQKTDLEKCIINRSDIKNAETIAVFSDRIEPYILSEKMKKSLKIEITISVVTGEEKAWCYKLYDYEEDWGSSNSIDMEYGILTDISEDELIKITKERAEKKYGENEYKIKNTDDKYLSESLVKIKNDLGKKDSLKRKERLKDEIKKKKDELSKLERNLNY